MVAAFVDGEQRGVGLSAEVPFFLGNGYAFLMMVYCNDATGGETMDFKHYDASEDTVYDCDQTLGFSVNMVEGDVEFPFELHFSTDGDDGGGDDSGDFVSSGMPPWDEITEPEETQLGVLDNYNDYEFNGSVTSKVYLSLIHI